MLFSSKLRTLRLIGKAGAALLGVTPFGHPAIATHAPPRAGSSRPNIILIVLDTARADRVGPQKNGTTLTPFLDALARRGLAFRNAFSPADATPASHFSMLTGYPAGAFTSSLDVPGLSVVSDLNQAGYDTVGLTANPNVDPATMSAIRPFQTFVSSPFVTPSDVTRDVYEQILKYRLGPPGDPRELDSSLGKLLSSAESMNARLSDVLQRCGDGLSRRPFFLFLNLLDAHDPYVPPGRWAPSQQELMAEWPVNGDLRTHVGGRKPGRLPVARPWQYATRFSPAGIRFLRELYDRGIQHLDSQLSLTFEILASHGLLHNTVVVVTSDHGEALGEHGYFSHSLATEYGIYLEENFRVPLVIRGYDVLLRPMEKPGKKFDTSRIADSIRVWAGIGPVNAAEGFSTFSANLDPIAVIEPMRPSDSPSKTIMTSSSMAHNVTPPPPGASPADRRQENKELIRRLRALGYLN